MLGRVVEKSMNGRRLNPGGRSLSMAKRTRENVAILLFFPALVYLVLMGWENFVAANYVGLHAWRHVLVPTALMVVALIVWPRRPDDGA